MEKFFEEDMSKVIQEARKKFSIMTGLQVESEAGTLMGFLKVLQNSTTRSFPASCVRTLYFYERLSGKGKQTSLGRTKTLRVERDVG